MLHVKCWCNLLVISLLHVLFRCRFYRLELFSFGAFLNRGLVFESFLRACRNHTFATCWGGLGLFGGGGGILGQRHPRASVRLSH